MTSLSDQDRIKRVYLDDQGGFRVWGDTPYHQLVAQVAYTETSFREHLYAALRAEGWLARNPLELRVLEIGCGWGRNFPLFLDIGIPEGNLHGVDLLQPFVERCRQRYPAAQVCQGDASKVLDAGCRFDLVLLHTVLSAILDGEVHRQILQHAASCLAPGGLLAVMDIVDRYPEGRIAVDGQQLQFIRPFPRHQLLAFGERAGMRRVYAGSFGLTPRLRSIVYAQLARFVRNPVVLRLMADMLSLISGRRSHCLVMLKQSPALGPSL